MTTALDPLESIAQPGPAPPSKSTQVRGGNVGGPAYRSAMVFWQLTIDANDPARLARFCAQALGNQQVPPDEPETAW